MEKKEIITELADAMRKYGEFAIAGRDLKKLLDKDAVSLEVGTGSITFQQLGLLLVEVGEILEQDEGKQRYVVVVPTGIMKAMRSLVVVKYNAEFIALAAYAREGLIKQNGAKQALDTIANKIQSIKP